jgi:hypothetical protein
MSTHPEDEAINLLSRWLARHADDDELRRGLEGVESEDVQELREGLDAGASWQQLEVAVRETLETLALG